jgi:hypothetical protein
MEAEKGTRNNARANCAKLIVKKVTNNSFLPSNTATLSFNKIGS